MSCLQQGHIIFLFSVASISLPPFRLSTAKHMLAVPIFLPSCAGLPPRRRRLTPFRFFLRYLFRHPAICLTQTVHCCSVAKTFPHCSSLYLLTPAPAKERGFIWVPPHPPLFRYSSFPILPQAHGNVSPLSSTSESLKSLYFSSHSTEQND